MRSEEDQERRFRRKIKLEEFVRKIKSQSDHKNSHFLRISRLLIIS